MLDLASSPAVAQWIDMRAYSSTYGPTGRPAADILPPDVLLNAFWASKFESETHARWPTDPLAPGGGSQSLSATAAERVTARARELATTRARVLTPAGPRRSLRLRLPTRRSVRQRTSLKRKRPPSGGLTRKAGGRKIDVTGPAVSQVSENGLHEV